MQRQVRQLALAALLVAAAGACQKQEARPAEAEANAHASAAARTAAPAAGPSNTASGDAFELELKAPASASADQPGELLIAIAAKPGFKINAEYPHAFRPEKDSGVAFDAAKYDLAAGAKTPCEKKAEDACRLEAKVPFKATTAGAQKASGTVAFSVCNDEVCLIEKVPVTATIAVN